MDVNRTDYDDDGQSLEQMMAGEERGFVALYRKYHAPVYQFSLQIGGNRPIAEEVTQETFLPCAKELSGRPGPPPAISPGNRAEFSMEEWEKKQGLHSSRGRSRTAGLSTRFGERLGTKGAGYPNEAGGLFLATEIP